MKRYWNGVTAHAAVTKIMYGCTLHIIYFVCLLILGSLLNLFCPQSLVSHTHKFKTYLIPHLFLTLALRWAEWSKLGMHDGWLVFVWHKKNLYYHGYVWMWKGSHALDFFWNHKIYTIKCYNNHEKLFEKKSFLVFMFTFLSFFRLLVKHKHWWRW